MLPQIIIDYSLYFESIPSVIIIILHFLFCYILNQNSTSYCLFTSFCWHAFYLPVDNKIQNHYCYIRSCSLKCCKYNIRRNSSRDRLKILRRWYRYPNGVAGLTNMQMRHNDRGWFSRYLFVFSVNFVLIIIYSGIGPRTSKTHSSRCTASIRVERITRLQRWYKRYVGESRIFTHCKQPSNSNNKK